ncbi:thioredoxin [Enterococcus sp. JM4C]|uniref:DsbA family protein n=1 Tax=Candidatus Enterococcus huntleyi TaxID=1857217 RepID=UPI00137A9989|nr:DsbA family protein [Enterococcus sp. JM4C]KAF1298612.1 thioredoxin [Enterococcus sp. JM4C]
MDISIIKANRTNSLTGLKIGSDDAPKKMIEFINVRCPFCRKWFEESYDVLFEAVSEGKVQRIIKFFDKEKESLQRGNVMQHYITQTDGVKALQELKKIFSTQDEWGELSLEEVATFAEETLNLTEQFDQKVTQSIIDEAAEANIQFVPTIIVNEHIFDESITLDELNDIIS